MEELINKMMLKNNHGDIDFTVDRSQLQDGRFELYFVLLGIENLRLVEAYTEKQYEADALAQKLSETIDLLASVNDARPHPKTEENSVRGSNSGLFKNMIGDSKIDASSIQKNLLSEIERMEIILKERDEELYSAKQSLKESIQKERTATNKMTETSKELKKCVAKIIEQQENIQFLEAKISEIESPGPGRIITKEFMVDSKDSISFLSAHRAADKGNTEDIEQMHLMNSLLEKRIISLSKENCIHAREIETLNKELGAATSTISALKQIARHQLAQIKKLNISKNSSTQIYLRFLNSMTQLYEGAKGSVPFLSTVPKSEPSSTNQKTVQEGEYRKLYESSVNEAKFAFQLAEEKSKLLENEKGKLSSYLQTIDQLKGQNNHLEEQLTTLRKIFSSNLNS